MARMLIRRLGLLALAFLCGFLQTTIASAQEQITRPPITGISRVQVYVTNAEKAADFYERLLGFAAAPWGCSKEMVACLVLNNRQQIQLIAAPSPVPKNLIAEVAFATPDVERMRAYLISKGYAPDSVSTSEDGYKHFTVRDPEGHAISFMQLLSRVAAIAPNQISARLIHAGFIVHDRQAEDHFYKDVLGFHLYWQGGMKDNEISWVSMQVPDGREWLEYMLNVSPDAGSRVIGIMNHIALGVVDIQVAKQQFLKNGGMIAEEPKLGRDGKWQLNLYDPNDTRVEIMEFKPKEKPCCSPFAGEHPSP